MKKSYKILGITLIVILTLLAIWRASFLFSFKREVSFGVTFSQKQAQDLNLDWQQTYSAILSDLEVKNLRLIAYWDQIEKTPGTYDFSDLDWQMEQARLHNAKVILVVGSRVPRWPECHVPTWSEDLAQSSKEEALLNYLQVVINHYKTFSNLEIWQVENEPFLKMFGLCPGRNKPLLMKELALVKKLDPVHPTMVTDSGELATWFRTRNLADYLGTSVYRVAHTPIGYINYRNIIPAAYYKFKAFMINKPDDKIIVSELQAEPWTTQKLTDTPESLQAKTMDLARFNENILFAKNLGFSRVYLWGAEWWYWKNLNGNSSIWDASKELF